MTSGRRSHDQVAVINGTHARALTASVGVVPIIDPDVTPTELTVSNTRAVNSFGGARLEGEAATATADATLAHYACHDSSRRTGRALLGAP